MTNHEIISKLAETIYLRRINEPESYNAYRCENDVTDWKRTEDIFDFFESGENSRHTDFWWDYLWEDYKWLYPLYCKLKGIPYDEKNSPSKE